MLDFDIDKLYVRTFNIQIDCNTAFDLTVSLTFIIASITMPNSCDYEGPYSVFLNSLEKKFEILNSNEFAFIFVIWTYRWWFPRWRS